MKVNRTKLSGVLLIEPRIFRDNRGHFLETYHAARYSQQTETLPSTFVQDNLSHSTRNVLRGLHYQLGRPQGKLIMVLNGEIYDVAVDIRTGSPTFGQWVGTILSSNNYCQIYIPEGFAHGFCVTGESATILYKCTDYYDPAQERGIAWDDPALSIDWQVTDPILSEKDRSYPSLHSVSQSDLPVFRKNQ